MIKSTFKLRRHVVFLILCALQMSSRIVAAPTSSPSTKDEQVGVANQNADVELRRYQQRVAMFYNNPDISALKKLADELFAKWNDSHSLDHLRLILEVCQLFKSLDFGLSNSNNQTALAQSYARLALAKSDSMPVDVEIGFVLCFSRKVGNLDNMELNLAAPRSDESKLWLHPLNRLAMEIDKNYDFEQPIYRTVVPPKGVNPSIVGMSPNDVSDPKLRAEYQAAIDKNNQKIRERSRQRNLRKMEEYFMPMAEKRLIRLYSQSPYNARELKQLLDEYAVNKDTQKRILDAVAQRMRLTVEGAKADPATPQSVEKK